MSEIANKKVICEVLLEQAETDQDIVVLCSDSKGSSSMTPFAEKYPERFVEVGIAEQNLVSIAAGLAKVGKKPITAAPACFLTTRSYEQCKIDVAYSNMNVKLLGVSGGVSYGALGMSHHSLQDIASMSAIPNMRVYLPSDGVQTKALMKQLLKDNQPAYIRVGRNPVEKIYDEETYQFQLNKANVTGDGTDVVIVACGEMVKHALDAKEILAKDKINAKVIDMYCVKPLDEVTLLNETADSKLIVSVEEHSKYGGLGSQVSQTISSNKPKKVINLALPDEPIITGKSNEVFNYYGLDGEGIARVIRDNLWVNTF